MCRGSQSATTSTGIVPSLVSAKQCPESWCVVTNRTSWPLFCNANAASTTNLSAPPIPRSGCKNVIRTIARETSGPGLLVNVVKLLSTSAADKILRHLDTCFNFLRRFLCYRSILNGNKDNNKQFLNINSYY